MLQKKQTLLFAFLAISLGSFLQAQSVTDLGDLGGGSSNALGLNSQGQVVGYSATSGGDSDAFLYSGGVMTDLGTLPGYTGSSAEGINDSGQIVGNATTGNGIGEAFLYSNGTMTDLGTLGGTGSNATGINNSGQIVGYAATNGGNLNAFLYSGGTMSSLGTLGGNSSEAYGINSSGQVAGDSTTSGNTFGINSFLYSGGTMTNLGNSGAFPGYNDSGATGINDAAQVVGESSQGANLYHEYAFLYSGGTMMNLGTLPGYFSSTATGINNSGLVVGTAADNNIQAAFTYSTATGLQNLNSIYASLLVSGTGSQSGFTSLTEANAVNNSGEIVGEGTYWNGTTDLTEGFLLNTGAVPEPSTWALLLGGFGLLVVYSGPRRLDALRRHKAQLLLVLPLLSTFLMTGCGPGHPAKDEILNHLNGSLDVSQPYQFTDIQPNFYPQGDGSVTIKGSLTGKLKDDLYARSSYEDRLKELGYDDAAWRDAVHDAQLLREPYRSALLSQLPRDFQNHLELVLIKIATPSGSDVNFNFQTVATRGPSGWSFGNDQIVPSNNLPGSPKTSFGPDALVVGSDDEKSKDQAYIDQTQSFIKAVEDSKKTIAAENEKARQILIAATTGGKNYLGTYTGFLGSWPMGLSITEQQQIGIGVTLKGYLFDPADPTRKKDLVGHLEFDPSQAQGLPIRLAKVASSGIDPSLVRPGNGTDRHLNRDANYGTSWNINLTVDAQGNLAGPDSAGHLSLAPKP